MRECREWKKGSECEVGCGLGGGKGGMGGLRGPFLSGMVARGEESWRCRGYVWCEESG